MVQKKSVKEKLNELANLVVLLKKLEGSSPVAHPLVLGMSRNPNKSDIKQRRDYNRRGRWGVTAGATEIQKYKINFEKALPVSFYSCLTV